MWASLRATHGTVTITTPSTIHRSARGAAHGGGSDRRPTTRPSSAAATTASTSTRPTGRTRPASPNSTPAPTARAGGRCRISPTPSTTSAAADSATKLDSVSAGALLNTRFGASATTPAANSPARRPITRRPTTPTHATVTAPATMLSPAAVHHTSSGSGVWMTSHHATANNAG